MVTLKLTDAEHESILQVLNREVQFWEELEKNPRDPDQQARAKEQVESWAKVLSKVEGAE